MVDISEIVMAVDALLLRKYFPYNTPEPCTSPEKAVDWLYADIVSILTNSQDPSKAEREILHIIEKTGYARYIMPLLPMHEIRNEMKLRHNLADALNQYKDPRELAAKLRYTLSDDDVLVLARLHRRHKHREEIEDLCNQCRRFKECTVLIHKDYSFFFM